jgi:pSer/pThr/pTyr-binding forkhead associated (FHA) protein
VEHYKVSHGTKYLAQAYSRNVTHLGPKKGDQHRRIANRQEVRVARITSDLGGANVEVCGCDRIGKPKAMYKYNCRKCPVRNRCIDESATAPAVKEIIRQAFAVRTDTLETWGALQPDCLLLKAEKERARTAPRESMLSRRLRQAREARQQAAKALSASAGQRPDYLEPVSLVSPAEESQPNQTTIGAVAAPDPLPLSHVSEGEPATDRLSPRWLTVIDSGRHIALPADKELVLGRFDPNFGIPPDVDLAYEDRGAHTVSRQHARIVGTAGHHVIEDLGSQHGLFVNGLQLRPGPPHQLRLGDRIELGNIQLLYDRIPAHVLDRPSSVEARHVLIVAPSGRRVPIAPPTDILIGRSDRYVDFVPDIDLSREGEVAVRVSRRHAIITWRDDVPHLEDLGSGFGTRLNGETLFIGHAASLKPGDHIWLGGCVLGYDIEM